MNELISKKYINDMAYNIIGCAIEVHKALGPGLLESIYEMCLCEELEYNGYDIIRQKSIPIVYRDKVLSADLKLDILVEDLIVIELKTVEKLMPVHEAQILSYMKLLQKPKGLLINFNSDNITKNHRPFVNEWFKNLPES